MFNWIKKIATRADFFASHCYGRIKSCIPLSLFYAVDGVTNGVVKKGLNYFGLGTLPAISTFFYYLFSFFHKAKETYEKHPDSSNLDIQHERLIATTEMIQGQLKKYSQDASLYLSQLNINDKHITELLQPEMKSDPIDIFSILTDVFQKIHPHQLNYSYALLDALLHGISHLNEYLLLKYFADLNLLNYEETPVNQICGFLILGFAIISGIQTFSFNNRPKHPTAEKLLECIPNHFIKFREERLTQCLTVNQNGTFAGASHKREQIKKFAADNAAQKCYLSCG